MVKLAENRKKTSSKRSEKLKFSKMVKINLKQVWSHMAKIIVKKKKKLKIVEITTKYKKKYSKIVKKRKYDWK